MINIWKTQLKKKQPLILIIPVLFYHGKEKWKIRRFEEYFDGIDDYLKAYIPDFNFIFTDIGKVPDDMIINTLFDRVANKILFLLLKHVTESEYLNKHLKDF